MLILACCYYWQLIASSSEPTLGGSQYCAYTEKDVHSGLFSVLICSVLVGGRQPNVCRPSGLARGLGLR